MGLFLITVQIILIQKNQITPGIIPDPDDNIKQPIQASSVQTEMKNVNFHIDSGIVLQIQEPAGKINSSSKRWSSNL